MLIPVSYCIADMEQLQGKQAHFCTSEVQRSIKYKKCRSTLAPLVSITSNRKCWIVTAELKFVTLDTQLHEAVLTGIIDTMKDFVEQFLPASLTSNKFERMNLIP